MEEWYGELYALIWDELESDKVALIKPYQTIYLLKNEGIIILWTKETTDIRETLAIYFYCPLKKLQKINEIKNKKGNYKWLNYKSTFVGHLLNDLPAFSRFNIPIGETEIL